MHRSNQRTNKRSSRNRRQNQETQRTFATSLAREGRVYAAGAQRRGGWRMRLVGWALQGLEKEADKNKQTRGGVAREQKIYHDYLM